MNWFLKAFKQYAVFSGRARRKEYWMFVLFAFIIQILAAVLDNLLDITFPGPYMFYGPIYIIAGLVMILPNLAVTIRRLHDTGKSGWFIFISLIPFIGSIWLLVLMFTNSQPGENSYGPNPKEVTE